MFTALPLALATRVCRAAVFSGLVLAVLGAGVTPARAQLRVVTTTEDLAALTREVGGDAVSVFAIAKGYQDPHFVDPKPSFILELSRADLLVVVGRELEIGWLPPLITSSRNRAVQPGGSGYLDASLNVNILEIPTGQITRAMGDVHPQGNPHYWLDPANGRLMAQAIRDRLKTLLPAQAAGFDARYADFDRRLGEAEARWEATLAPYRNRPLVTYHRSWPNFMERFGLNVIGYVEPKPGIPPSPAHTIELIAAMRAQDVQVIVVEPYFDKRTPQSIASQVSGRVVELAPSVGGLDGADTYVGLFDTNVGLIADALRATAGQ